MAEVRMPKMGDGMEEGTINTWLKNEGDQVNAGEPIAEVETDKANVEISAYESGVLTKIVVQQGQTVPVGEVIAHIGAVAEKRSGNGAHSGPEGSLTGDVEIGGDSDTENSPQSERVKASPLARKKAKELGIDLARVSGTGPGGRIVDRDVITFHDGGGSVAAAPALKQAAPAAKAATLPAAHAKPQPHLTVPPSPSTMIVGQEIKPSRMREAIARRTLQSKQNIPHFYVTMIVEMDRAQALLKDLNANPELGKITVNDLVVKACAVALGRIPQVNATWTPEGTVRQYAETHIGIAVGIDEGLIIPVVRDCHVKTLRQISADTKALVGKARNHQLKPEDYSGGTFSISNMGMMGVDEFIAIINPPEAAILSIGTIVREPVVVGDTDEIAIRSRMKITIAADHRVLDGVVGARFLNEVKGSLEAPLTLLS